MGTDELSELKAQFLSSLNYEIRTPLTGIMGMLDLLLETELTEEQKEYADITHVCAENLLGIMNSTLEFCALSANQVTLEEGEFPLHNLMDWIVAEYSPKAEAKGLRFIRGADHGTLPDMVIGDALRLKQLLGNLVENAVKFTTHGEIEVGATAKRIDDFSVMLCLHVRDTGIGIHQDKLDCIFDSFRQLDTGLTRRYTGMGLGLAVTQKLATLMDAKLAVISKAGRGSTFSLSVPVRLPQEAKWAVAESAREVFRARVA